MRKNADNKLVVTLIDVLRFCRAFEWGVHLSVFVLIAFTCYSIIEIEFNEFIYYLISIAIYVICLSSFAYMINDLSDKELDKKQGKPKPFRNLPSAYVCLIAFALAVMSLITLTISLRRADVVLIGLVQILFSYFYSCRPVRLKERGILGLLTAAIMQRVPHFIMLAICVSMNETVAVLVSIWLSLLGLLFIIEHQIEDWEKDSLQDVKTFAVLIGFNGSLKFRSVAYYCFSASGLIFAIFYFVPIGKSLLNTEFAGLMILLSAIAVLLLRWRYKSIPVGTDLS